MVTSESSSMKKRSLTLSTASAAVGVQMPPEQLMFCVGSLEITTAASAALAAGKTEAKNPTATARIKRASIFMASPRKQPFYQIRKDVKSALPPPGLACSPSESE